MSQQEHIGVFYSLGFNFDAILKAARARHPSARITAIVPSGFVPAAGEERAADAFEYTPRAHYAPYQVLAILALLRRLRALRFDRFVVMFPTLQLRVFAALSGAPACECWARDNVIYPIPPSPARVVFEHCTKGVFRRMDYLRMWCKVRIRRVGRVAHQRGK